MNSADLRTKVLEEIKDIPDHQLAEVYDLLQTFRLNSNPQDASEVMSFSGCWKDLPDEVYQDFLDEISDRRQTAFSERRDRESRFD